MSGEKSKSSEGDNLETRIIDVMARHPKGVGDQILQEAIPTLTKQQLVDCLNELGRKKKIQFFKKGKQLVYKLINDAGSSKKCQGGDIEEQVVFDAVKRAGNNGVAAKDLKYQCNLPQPQITKILKVLVNKMLVKNVTSTTKKKLFMLYDLEPSREITGGTFYSGQDFESEFVDVLTDQCYRYLLQAKTVADQLSDPILQKNASFKSSKEICDYITSLEISRVQITVKDIEQILESLIYDGKIEKTVSLNKSSAAMETQHLYRVLKPLLISAGLMRMPCGVCLVYQDCRVGGPVSPSTCVYMKEWLEF